MRCLDSMQCVITPNILYIDCIDPQLPSSSSCLASPRECLSTCSITSGRRIFSRLRLIFLPSLNVRSRWAGSVLDRGSIFVSIFIPSNRALGGINERNRRAGLARAENGLNLTRTSVRKRVIMVAVKEELCKEGQVGWKRI